MTITRDEWLAELERVMAHRGPGADGLTAKELAERWGCCRRVALERLQLLHDRLVVGNKRALSVAGRQTQVPCYKLKPVETRRAAKRRSTHPK
jgi:hypothetical protein